MTDARLNFDRSAMFLYDPINRGKSQARSFSYIFGGKKRIKDPGKIFRLDPITRIGNFQPYFFFVNERIGAHGQDAFALHGIDGIGHQIDQHLIELPGVSDDLGQVRVYFLDDLDVLKKGLFPQKTDGLLQGLVDIAMDPAVLGLTAEIEQFLTISLQRKV